MNPLTRIRSLAIGKANALQRCHRYLDTLMPAFAEWAAGEIYVCRKTGDYRYRFGERSKNLCPWNATAREVFATPAAFAFGAMVFAPDVKPSPAQEKPAPAPHSQRANIIQLARAAA